MRCLIYILIPLGFGRFAGGREKEGGSKRMRWGFGVVWVGGLSGREFWDGWMCLVEDGARGGLGTNGFKSEMVKWEKSQVDWWVMRKIELGVE